MAVTSKIVGEIARMVEVGLSSQGREIYRLDAKTARSVNVVAGACNHRDLTIKVPI